MEYGSRWKEDEYDARLEHLVDVCNVSYEEARLALGPPPYEIMTISASIENFAVASLGVHLHQRQVNHQGIAEVRRAFEAAHNPRVA